MHVYLRQTALGIYAVNTSVIVGRKEHAVQFVILAVVLVQGITSV